MATNYEKIKNMTVNEMAIFLRDFDTCSACEDYWKPESGSVCVNPCCCYSIKQWLLSEVE